MKIYPNVPCELSMQSYGSNWLMILRGDEQSIIETHNGLYNLCGTQTRELQFTTHDKSIAVCRSSKEQMERFFGNLFEFRHDSIHQHIRYGKHGVKSSKDLVENFVAAKREWVQEQILALRKTMETFTPFTRGQQAHMYALGDDRAERPDEDFKSNVLNHAFSHNINEIYANKTVQNLEQNHD